MKITGISFTFLLVALGVLLIVVGVADKIILQGYSIEILQAQYKIVAVGTGAALVLISIIYEIFRPTIKTTKNDDDDEVVTVGRWGNKKNQQVLAALDEEAHLPFPVFSKNAVALTIYARTAVNLTGNYYGQLKNLLASGCKLKFLLVNPDSAAAASIYPGTQTSFHQNFQTSLRAIEVLRGEYPSAVSVRLSDTAPTLGIILVERRKSAESKIHLQLYLHYAAIGRDRPVVQIGAKNRWYKVFLDELNQLWNAGVQ